MNTKELNQMNFSEIETYVKDIITYNDFANTPSTVVDLFDGATRHAPELRTKKMLASFLRAIKNIVAERRIHQHNKYVASGEKTYTEYVLLDEHEQVLFKASFDRWHNPRSQYDGASAEDILGSEELYRAARDGRPTFLEEQQ